MIARAHVLVIATMVLAMVSAGLVAFWFLPERVPVHWNVHGEVDRYGPRWEVALALPLGAAAMVALLLVLPRLGPFRGNFSRFASTYGRISVLILAFLLLVHAMLLATALGVALPVPAVTVTAVGLLLALLGNWLGKVRRNFWVGIRTPWTLANETVWERTHRIGGRLLVVFGLVLAMLALLAPGPVILTWLLGGLAAIVVWSFAYSLWLYRRLGSVDDMQVAEHPRH